jgi:hypothetical protein
MATDSLHMTPPRPSNRPATVPETTQMMFSHLPVMFLSSSIPSMSMLLPRETMKATRPQARAAAVASPTSTRHATLPTTSSFVQSQE